MFDKKEEKGNKMDAFKGAGRYTIDITNGLIDPSATPVVGVYGKFENFPVVMSLKLPKQTIRLRSVKVVLENANAALKMRSLGFELPFLSYNHCVDNSASRLAFTFPLNTESPLTFVHSLEKPLYMSKDAEAKYNITVRDADGNIADKINCIYLDFETEIGSVGS